MKKQCAVCQAKDVINVGKPLGHLCEKHMIDTYKAKFLAHRGRKIIIPPGSPDKYISYQFETIGSLKSYGWDANDLAPVQEVFSKMPKSGCSLMQSRYEAQDFLNVEQFETANWKQKTRTDAAVFVISTLPAFMDSNGISLPPDGDDDIIIYPLRS